MPAPFVLERQIWVVINDALDGYRTIAAGGAQEANTFKFYQSEVMLEPA
jgi:hypothetical protein